MVKMKMKVLVMVMMMMMMIPMTSGVMAMTMAMSPLSGKEFPWQISACRRAFLSLCFLPRRGGGVYL
jgi:hypothetical protein